jgi:hypothetical protein
MGSTINAAVRSCPTCHLNNTLPFVAGTSAGGFLLGAVSGTAGLVMGWLFPAWWALLLLATLGSLATAYPRTSSGWPEIRQQVPRWWVQPPRAYGLFLSGAVLGFGLATYVRHSIFYVFVATLVISGMAWFPLSLAVGLAYGALTGVADIWRNPDSQHQIAQENSSHILAVFLGRTSLPIVLLALIGSGIVTP